MRIVHVAPFAPGQCGLYATTHDMIVAERMLGHEAVLVDSGIVTDRSIIYHRGHVDRGVTAEPFESVAGADLLVTHTEPHPNIMALTQVPIVHIMHGRPYNSFLLSQKGIGPYDVYARWGKDPRRVAMVTLWPEHIPYWAALVPAGKLYCTGSPPCDLNEWKKFRELPCHAFSPMGEYNVLVADVWREDSSPYHAVHGFLRAAQDIPGLRVHFYGMLGNPLGPWNHLLRAMRDADILGETKGMMRDIGPVYAAADVVVTSHNIATRVVREALAVGTPVLMGRPNNIMPEEWTATIADPIELAEQLVAMSKTKPEGAMRYAEPFSLDRFGHSIMSIYEEATSYARV